MKDIEEELISSPSRITMHTSASLEGLMSPVSIIPTHWDSLNTKL